MKKNTLLVFGMLLMAIPWATAQNNTFFGYQAGYTASGSYNSFYGYRAGYYNEGSYNTFMGFQSGLTNKTGFDNVFLGQGAGQYNSSGSYNVYVGGAAGNHSMGSSNTFIGQSAGALNTNGSGNVFLGRSAGESEQGSNKLYINNSGGTPLIYGEFDTRKVGINTITPRATLDVNGSIQISSASIPMGLIPEVNGTTPLLSLSINNREGNKMNQYMGAAFRLDSRPGSPTFQWITRAASSTADLTVMSLTNDGNLKVQGNVLAGSKLVTNAITSPNAPDGTVGKMQIGYDPSIPDRMPGITIEKFVCSGCVDSGNDPNLKRVLINTKTGVNGTALSVAGAVHIRDRNATDGRININKIDQYLLWVEKGIVSNDYAIAEPSTWSDYVFDKSYVLKDLSSVKKYIETNGHLPNIPSETEIKENGYSVHEMNTKLLEKIEELTLYTIEQQKKIDQLFKLLEQQPKVK